MLRKLKIAAITPDNKHDYLTATIIEGLNSLPYVEIACTSHGNYARNILQDDEFVKFAATADAVLVFFGKVRGNSPPKRYLLDRIGSKNIAYVDGSEWTCTGYPESSDSVSKARLDASYRRGTPWIDTEMRSTCRYYFKRECYPEDEKDGIVPLLFGTMLDDIDDPLEHEYDVFCSFGQTNDGLRKEAVDLCKRLINEGKRVFLGSSIPRSEYRAALQRSLVAIDAWGGGDCCARLWEIAAMGICPIYQRYNIVFPDAFEEGQSCLAFSTARELEDRVREAIADRERTAMIGLKAQEHTLRYHTSTRRAEFVLRKMGLIDG